MLPREPMSRSARTFRWFSHALWALSIAVAAMILPQEVPIHWGAGSVFDAADADRWTSTFGALAFMVSVGAIVMALVLLSRIVLHLPAALNHREKQWWTASGARLIRFERLTREDLTWITGTTLILMTGMNASIMIAALGEGALSQWYFWAWMVACFTGIAAVVVRIISGVRYLPATHSDL